MQFVWKFGTFDQNSCELDVKYKFEIMINVANSMKDLKHHFGNFSLLLDKLIFLANLRVKQPKMHVEDPVDKIRGKTKKKTETDALDYMFDS